jgi:tRNA nucleotidyltransferase (CCA-adding enzyme)
MSDYMFMLESHLSTDQNRVVSEVQAAAAEANASLFLTGGAMRDMLGGFPIRDLDFTIEGNALKIARTVAKKTGARVTEEDGNRWSCSSRAASRPRLPWRGGSVTRSRERDPWWSPP